MESRTTFAKLIADRGQVRIPIIQRDYAQGRTEQKDVRNDFLGALHDALSWPQDDARLPLDLDFVYGNDAAGAFQPLDGQQRLTTLFLLHWYLAWADGKLDDFRVRFIADGQSRFSYQVRPSSRDFVDEIARFDPGPFKREIDLVALIRDQQWYVRAWQFDQTVRSALDMLGAMHVEFGQSPGLYERLIDPKNPAVAFQLLDLEDFALTDELYIKMNARGKALTQFETFKARFEQHLKVNFTDLKLPQSGVDPVNKFFAKRMDREWSDFFWPYRDKQNATFDAAVMNLLRVLIIVTRDPERGTTTDAELADLRGDLPNTFMAFNERGWLDRSLVITLVALLECWSGPGQDLPTHLPDDSPYDIGATFGKIITDPSRLTFQDLVIFAGYAQFVRAAEGTIGKIAFGEWMRVVYNLGVNTDYNRSEDLRRSLSGLASVSSRMSDINAYLTEPSADIRGFSQPQVLEERLKARLFALGDGWQERVTVAERHDYLEGQIGFLLEFVGFDLGEANREPTPPERTEADKTIENFEHYFACARQMLKDLRNGGADGRAWELALLSVGDIRLEAGRNWALPSFKDGQGSWKRLLRLAAAGEPQGDVVKDLWDRLPDLANTPEALRLIIETEWDDEPWRRVVINTPAVLKYCGERLIRFDDAGIYPLKRSQMNGAHVELYTYGAYAALQEDDRLKSLIMHYNETYSVEEPSIGLECLFEGKKCEFLLMSRQDHENYDLWLQLPKSPPASLARILAKQGFSIDGGFLNRVLRFDELQPAILNLDGAIIRVDDQKAV